MSLGCLYYPFCKGHEETRNWKTEGKEGIFGVKKTAEIHFSISFNAREIENLHMKEGHMGSRHNAGGQTILSKEPTQRVYTHRERGARNFA